MNGLGNNCIQDKCSSPSTKAPTGKDFHSPYFTTPIVRTSLIHITHLNDLDLDFSNNFPFSVDTSPIGYPVTLPKLVLQACIMSLIF
jgi:hypothetical protein